MLVEKAAKEEELWLVAKELASFTEKSILSEEDLEAVKKERGVCFFKRWEGQFSGLSFQSTYGLL